MNSPVANPAVVKVARQARGLSQAQLADQADVSQAAVSKLEAGIMQPTAELIEKLAGVLSFPVTLFYETDPIFGVPVSVSYRKRASVGARAIDRLEAEINLRLMHLRRLLSSIEHVPELPFPELDVDSFGGSGTRVAQLVRQHWGVPSGPLIDLTSLVERAGCIVLPCEFESLGVDGLTLRPPGLPVCIFLNSSMPGDRQRFTLAHELGHAIMHRLPSAEMEQQADDFAAEMLMPARDMIDAFASGISLARLAALKPIWRVSMAALLYRAKALGCISTPQSQALWRQMSALGYRRQEPPETAVPAERATVFADILRAYREELGYSLSELAQLLHMHADELRGKYGLIDKPPAVHLRLVK
ncbi:ImmA/IrrE family metallo-endopeptidase [uncultured Azohydromonas sp.]|jgi:Predicted Zn peptidase|uniref:ImmA/IrrE family metallo-endopeptidase n=1 Tax=uncultured Azohydromonas sp. TaxID=487342 RepID=UPI00260864FF|nr:ImmA/IrrE family metallo-endopeptidase [uncultured Azohydromonas sp.]